MIEFLVELDIVLKLLKKSLHGQIIRKKGAKVGHCWPKVHQNEQKVDKNGPKIDLKWTNMGQNG